MPALRSAEQAHADYRHDMTAQIEGRTVIVPQPFGQSRKFDPVTGVVPIAMTRAMIDEVVEAYARAAVQCEQWGIDGLELHGSHSYLPAQFLSPGQNRRTDDYGGSFENRVRFALETSTPITRNIKSPTIVIGRFRTLEEADQVIRAGDADMVAMTRAHIAEPHLVRKTLAGHPEQVRPRIGCNQGCLAGSTARCPAWDAWLIRRWVLNASRATTGWRRWISRRRPSASAAARRGWRPRASPRHAGTRSYWPRSSPIWAARGIAAAEYLVDRGLSVTLITRHAGLAPPMDLAWMTEPAFTRLSSRNFAYYAPHPRAGGRR
nr:hypothetical protein [Sphingomonas sp. CDS-1]